MTSLMARSPVYCRERGMKMTDTMGYYDDVLPEDYGHPAEGLDRELLKRVALVMGGMLFAAVACAAIMYLL